MTPNSSIKHSHNNNYSNLSPSKNNIQSLRTVVGVNNKNIKMGSNR